ncbi:hypothetical protein [Arcobacter sp.]|uniref:hypothetical protein n=1 Tax=unclassified Arcobacter TaxID=2593671 RepID=UPI003B003352
MTIGDGIAAFGIAMFGIAFMIAISNGHKNDGTIVYEKEEETSTNKPYKKKKNSNHDKANT